MKKYWRDIDYAKLLKGLIAASSDETLITVTQEYSTACPKQFPVGLSAN